MSFVIVDCSSIETMAQSLWVVVQKKGKIVHVHFLPSSPHASAIVDVDNASFAVSGACVGGNTTPIGGHVNQENKYPAWKYVTKRLVLRKKGGGNCCWRCPFWKVEFKSTYFHGKRARSQWLGP